MNNEMIVKTPTPMVRLFLSKSDRALYSKPLSVVPLYSDISTRLTFVYEPKLGRTFPVSQDNLSFRK